MHLLSGPHLLVGEVNPTGTSCERSRVNLLPGYFQRLLWGRQTHVSVTGCQYPQYSSSSELWKPHRPTALLCSRSTGCRVTASASTVTPNLDDTRKEGQPAGLPVSLLPMLFLPDVFRFLLSFPVCLENMSAGDRPLFGFTCKHLISSSFLQDIFAGHRTLG